MKFKKISPFLIVFFSALLATLSHPTVILGYSFPNLGFLAWITYIPLFLILENRSPKQQFKLAFLFGVFFNLGSMYWLYTALNSFGHLSPLVSILVLFVLILILSTYFGILFFLSAWIENCLRISRFWVLPIVWIAVEWCRGHFPVGGFPWGQVGYSQGGYPSIIQIADLTGVYGVTAVVVWVNLAFSLTLFRLRRREGKERGKWIFIGFLLSSVLLYSHFSQKNVLQKIQDSPRLRVALLQGNIPQNEKWLSERADQIVQTYETMTHQALALGADLVIWPESAYPYEISLDQLELLESFWTYSKDLLLGAVTFDGTLPPGTNLFPPGFPIHNSGILIPSGSNKIEAYHKQHLVPYGEYVPLREILPFVKKLTAQLGEFQPGREFNLLNSGEAKMGLLICYEDVFPEISRGHTKGGANMLVNLSNDAWYGNSSALPQHLNFSIFRAVENRRYLVRSTNTGVTAIIDPTGKIEKSLPVFVKDLLVDEVSLLSFPLSFYSRFGDVFAFFCVTISGVLCLKSLLKKSKT